MSLPGLALPGLNDNDSSNPLSATAPASSISSSQTSPPRTETLTARSELRYEIAPDKPYTVKLLKGSAEIFGTELAPNVTYDISGTKGAVYSWHGATLEISGDAESEYVGTATEAMAEWLNLHGILEDQREDALAAAGSRNQTANAAANEEDDEASLGPRVLIIGPDAQGKSSLIKCLTAWSIKTSRTPTVINLDPKKPILSVPGTLSAVTVNTMLDIERDAWASSGPTTAPGGIPDKPPLVHHFPFALLEENTEYFKSVTTRMAMSVTARMGRDTNVRTSGLLIDTPGSAMNNPKTGYGLISHIVSEFSVNLVLVVGSDRLYNDMMRKYASSPSPSTATAPSGYGGAVSVLRLTPSPGAVADDTTYLSSVVAKQIRAYFFDARDSLHPKAYSWDFDELSVYAAVTPSNPAAVSASRSFLPGMGGDDDLDDNNNADGHGHGHKSTGVVFERIDPSPAMLNALIAIKFAGADDDHDTIRDSCVVGFAYVADVNEANKKLRVLYPHPGKLTDRAWVWCRDWPQAVADLAM